MNNETLSSILRAMFTDIARSGPVQMRHATPERWVQLELFRRLYDDERFTDVIPGEPPFRSDFKPKPDEEKDSLFFVDFFARFKPEAAFVWGELKVELRREGASKSRKLSKPGWTSMVTKDAARLLQLRLGQTASHWSNPTEYWHKRHLPGLARRISDSKHCFFCAYLEVDCAESESIITRPADYAKPVMKSVPTHLRGIAARIQRSTYALDVEPASMLTLIEWTADAHELRRHF